MSQTFDAAAASYDRSFTNTFTGRGQRNLVWKNLDKIIEKYPQKNLKILELNCGTGEDALHLAKLGHNVLATDLSPKMIEISKKKNENSALTNLAFQVLDINELERIEDGFDLIFSNFGGLNCLSPEQFAVMGKQVANLLNPNGVFVAVIMSRRCAWEQVYYWLKRNPQERTRRLRKEALSVWVDGTEVLTWFYSPQECSDLLQSHLKTEIILPVGIGYPPSYLNSAFEKRAVLRVLARSIERLFQNSSALANRADHFLITFTKR